MSRVRYHRQGFHQIVGLQHMTKYVHAWFRTYTATSVPTIDRQIRYLRLSRVHKENTGKYTQKYEAVKS